LQAEQERGAPSGAPGGFFEREIELNYAPNESKILAKPDETINSIS
jgi:hypothetical protein